MSKKKTRHPCEDCGRKTVAQFYYDATQGGTTRGYVCRNCQAARSRKAIAKWMKER